MCIRDRFGPGVTPDMIKTALKQLGFADVYETAIGAAIGAAAEAEHYVHAVATGELPFLLTSCCPSWSMLAKKFFPETIDNISNALTPMVATARKKMCIRDRGGSLGVRLRALLQGMPESHNLGSGRRPAL